MIINHNLQANNAIKSMNSNTANASNSMQKLSSGLRINKAGDDAAGLAISEKMRGQIRGLDQASSNAQDGISLIQTGEGGLNETQSILQRMRELAVQSSNDTNVSQDRAAIQKEMEQLSSEVSRIAGQTEFNTQTLLNSGVSLNFHVGANANQTITLNISVMNASALGVCVEKTAISALTAVSAVSATGASGSVLSTGSANSVASVDSCWGAVSITSQAAAEAAITVINSAITAVSSERANMGALQNRLEHTINNVNTSSENLTAAESRVRDVDMAKEMSTYSKNNILSQAAQAMLAQANQQPQQVLQLLR